MINGGKQQRMTRQRRIILEELAKVTSHPTAMEVFEMVRDRVPKVSLGTVYRNLELLASQRQILRLELPDEPMRFDATIDYHCHLKCTSCGGVFDLPADITDAFEDVAKKSSQFIITGYVVSFIGLCPICKTQQRS